MSYFASMELKDDELTHAVIGRAYPTKWTCWCRVG